jgi:phosphocarrier protein
MPERRVAVTSPDGLHARPAALFVKAAAATGIPVRIAKTGTEQHADARSILAVLSLDVRQGDEVLISADGDGADDVLDKLALMLGGEVADALG